MESEPQKINKSAERTVDLLLLFTKTRQPLTLSDISSMMSIPKSSAFELVKTLVYKKIIEVKDPKAKTYGLSLLAFEIGCAVISDLGVTDVARPYIQELNRSTGSTVFLGVEESGSIVYIDKAENHSEIKPRAKLGSRRYLHTTGLGKALLYAYSNERIVNLLGAEPYASKTPLSHTTAEEVLLDAKQTRMRGYAIDDREDNLDMYCISAPIYNSSNEPIAAISVANIYSTVSKEKEEMVAKLVSDTALSISHKLGSTISRIYGNFVEQEL